MPRTDRRVLLGKEKARKAELRSRTFRDELRDVLGTYDLELMYEDADRDEPKRFIRDQPDGTFIVQFCQVGWRPAGLGTRNKETRK